MNSELNEEFYKKTPKYVLCPGYVLSKNDGDRHYISAVRLAQLYRVPMIECVVRPNMEDRGARNWYPPKGAIELHPKFDGDYTLEKSSDMKPAEEFNAKTYEDGVPCSHPGCLHHVTHPCDGCGRIAGHSDN